MQRVLKRILKLEHIEAFKNEKKIEWLGLPYLISNGIFEYGSEKLRYLIIPKYSVSLESIREKQKKFDVQATFTIARSMLNSLEYMHLKNFTHADVKAGNILLMRSGDYCSSVLVDFGLARMSSNNEDKPDKKRAHNGTAIFTSLDAHRGCHPSFRGDIEILAYNMIYWLTGTLPWVALESSPDKIYIAKKEFMEDVSLALKELLQEQPKCITFLRDIFNVTLETEYSRQVDFDKLHKIVDGALRKRTLGRNKMGTKLIDGKVFAVKENLNDSMEITEDIDSSVEQMESNDKEEIPKVSNKRKKVVKKSPIVSRVEDGKVRKRSTRQSKRRSNIEHQSLAKEINKENGIGTPKEDVKIEDGKVRKRSTRQSKRRSNIEHQSLAKEINKENGIGTPKEDVKSMFESEEFFIFADCHINLNHFQQGKNAVEACKSI
uniref:non-specific serine/threonine protein kinase n=1 Tax=Heterorhabditis bacteriophora TaxID=37862 RepID=A0A1I7WRU6_HETBA